MGSVAWKWWLPAVGEARVGDERGRGRQAPSAAVRAAA